MPKSKKSSKTTVHDGDSKGDGQWVHIEKTEQIHQDSWELVDNGAAAEPAAPRQDIQNVDLSDDDLVEILEDNFASIKDKASQKLIYSSEIGMDKSTSSDFQIIEPLENESSSSNDANIEAEILEDTCNTKALDKMAMSCSNVISKSENNTDPKQQEGLLQPTTLEHDTSLPEIHQSAKTSGCFHSEQIEDMIPALHAKSSTGVSTIQQDCKVGDHHSCDPGNSKNKNKKKKKKKAKASAAPEDTDEEKVQDALIGDKPMMKKDTFVLYAKDKTSRDISTLSILLAKDETIENITTNISDAQSSISELAEILGPDQSQENIDRLEEDDLLVETDSIDQNIEKNGTPKLSKSAKRRKKQKAKVIKAIENFSNPSLFLEKYEKTFGEDYEPPANIVNEGKIDSSLICSICLDLYHQPHLVKPCGHLFCEPCLRKLTTKSSSEVPCPMCRELIQSCGLDDELSSHIKKTYPLKAATRNRAERKSKSKKNPLPRTEQQPLNRQLISQIITMTHRSRVALQKHQLFLNRNYIQKLLLVIICVISYLFTSLTIRAMSYYFHINSETIDNTSSNFFFMLIIFSLYFYSIDKGFKKFKEFWER